MYKRIIVSILFAIFSIGIVITSCLAENNLTAIEKYFAIEEGNKRTYQRKTVDDSIKEDSGPKAREDIAIDEITSVLKTENYTIAESKLVVPDMKEPLYFYLIITDNKVYSFNPNMVLGDIPRRYSLDDLASWIKKRGTLGEIEDQIFSYPLEVGQTWQGIASGGTYAVEKQEDVIVPAREFKDCYKITYKSKFSESIDWFCPGIGSVKTEWRNTGQHNTYGISELVEYQIK